ncbi:MAG: hypothetical protein CL910_22620 [Deltaproteobacteria bacterium]|jgi:hypothetical protein|nr:hypothetical protein [Deltaproteobacteria bacterium]
MDKEKVLMIIGTFMVLVVPGVCGVALVGVGSFVHGIEVQSPEDLAPAPPIVTLAEFERIEPDMSYEEVVDVIGDPGVEIGPSSAPETTTADADTVSYVWQNDDASNMTATFKNDRLLERSQLYLE